jgi:predicted ATPase
MFVTHVALKNWRNFKNAEANLRDKTYIIGPNASGKSNFLDVFRFLRDISKPEGGGLQKAVRDRGGISKLRCLHHRKDTEVRIEVSLSESPDADFPDWRYILGFKAEGTGLQRPSISKEQVWRGQEEKPLINRPDSKDKKDSVRLTQTFLEQINANSEFREIADFFGAVTYLHLVPQLLKHGDKIGGNRLEDDPFGQGFLERIAKCQPKPRDSRLAKIGKALQAAVPHFAEIRYAPDEATGRPHLEARYEHHRPNAGWQREDQFSDGTLRLLGLLWSLFEGDSLLLLEEPELSLNNAIVERIPLLFHRIQRSTKYKRQILISTHSEALLSSTGIDGRGVLCLTQNTEGSSIRPPSDKELGMLKNGMSVAEVLLPKVRPTRAAQLELF